MGSDFIRVFLYFFQSEHRVASYMVPNSGKIIASGDIQEINRLLQLILGCAVNSDRKDNFIAGIRELEEKVQVNRKSEFRR